MSFSAKNMAMLTGAILGAPVAGAGIQYVGTKVLGPMPSSPSKSNTAAAVVFYTLSNVAVLEAASRYTTDQAILAVLPVMLVSTQSDYIAALQAFYGDITIQ